MSSFSFFYLNIILFNLFFLNTSNICWIISINHTACHTRVLGNNISCLPLHSLFVVRQRPNSNKICAFSAFKIKKS